MSLEATLFAGGKVYLSASGPGPKVLVAGDRNLGYFGPVPVAELFTSTDIFTQYPEMATIGTPLPNVDPLWHKFLINNKVVYIALASIIANVSWNSLYSMGLIYGTDDNGLVPPATPVNQWRPLAKREGGVDWALTPRSIRVSSSDVVPTTTPMELDVAAVINIIKKGTGKGTGLWDSLVPADTNYGWSVNTFTNTLSALVYGNSTGVSYGTKTASTLRYFPVLDLQDVTKITFPVVAPRGTQYGPRRPDFVASVDYGDVIYPVDTTQVIYSQSSLDMPRISGAVAADMVMPTSGVTYTPYLKQPTLAAHLS